MTEAGISVELWAEKKGMTADQIDKVCVDWLKENGEGEPSY